MAEQQNNMRVIFTDKAELVLEDIVKAFGLEEGEQELAKRIKDGKKAKSVVINHLTSKFAKKIISDKELITSLQKDLDVSQEVAEKISKEIVSKLVPLLEILPEEKFNGQPFQETVTMAQQQNELSKNLPNIKPPIGIEKALEKKIPTPITKKLEKIKKITEQMETKETKQTIEKPTPQRQDIYREPIG